MSLNVSDPRIQHEYRTMLSNDSGIDWCSFGYANRSNTLVWTGSGTAGTEQLRDHLGPDDVRFGLLKVQHKLSFWTLIPESVGGVKRARALVHSKSLTNVFQSHHASFVATSPSDFDAPRIRSFLGLASSPRSSSTTTTSPPGSTLDQSVTSITTGSTVHPPHPARGRGHRDDKGKRRAVDQDAAPEVDLYHEYDAHRGVVGEPGPHANGGGADDDNDDGRVEAGQGGEEEEEDRPPEVPEKLPSAHQYGVVAPHRADAADRPVEPPSGAAIATAAATTPPPPPQEHRLAPSSATHRGLPPLGAALVRSTTPTSPPPPPRSPQQPPVVVARRDVRRREKEEAEEESNEGNAAALMMLSPRDARFDTIYHSVENDDSQDDDDDDHGGNPPTRAAAATRRETTTFEVERAAAAGERRFEDVEDAESDEVDAAGEDEDEDDILESYRDATDAGERDRIVAVAGLGQGRDEESRGREEEEEAAAAAAAAEEDERMRMIAHERAVAEEKEREEEEERLRAQAAAAEKEKEEEEEERLERTRRAEEEMRLMLERERLERKLRDEERLREEHLARERARQDLIDRRDAGRVMATGEVSVQSAGSMLWRRRYFQLTATALSFSKSQAESSKPLDAVAVAAISTIVAHPDEPLPPHSFKILVRGANDDDDDEWLLYGDGEEEKEMLIQGLRIAARLP
ncbi:hypothetical protein JCM11491_003525 [Sporobolomyces phaffii]